MAAHVAQKHASLDIAALGMAAHIGDGKVPAHCVGVQVPADGSGGHVLFHPCHRAVSANVLQEYRSQAPETGVAADHASRDACGQVRDIHVASAFLKVHTALARHLHGCIASDAQVVRAVSVFPLQGLGSLAADLHVLNVSSPDHQGAILAGTNGQFGTVVVDR